MQKMRVRITTTEGMLGTAPMDQDIYRRFIASKAPDAATIEEEVAAVGVDQVVTNGMTGFLRMEDDRPYIYDYQIRGMFKDSCGMLSRLTGKDPETGKKKKAVNESGKLTAYRKVIDGLIFVNPRKIPVEFSGEMSLCQRPLRAQTAQGERVALAISEEIPAGATMEFEVICFDDSHISAVREWLDYGAFRGLGQWRNSGKGKFYWEELDENGKVIGGNNFSKAG